MIRMRRKTCRSAKIAATTRTDATGTAPAPVGIGPRFRSLRAALLTCSALSVVVALPSQPARALPQGGTITEGSGQIVVKSPTEIAVIQNSDKLVIDWQSFNIAAGEKVVFVQADQLMQALNRVLGSAASTILGQLSAKGTVIITNPNGILFGNGAQVNVGAIIATTSGITNANFVAGKLNFDIPSTSDTASVVNRGTITAAEAGLVGLVAPGVENSGIIQARLGTVQMAAGNSFTVDLYGDKLIKLAVGDQVTKQVKAADGKDIKALVNSTGTLSADGGTILLTAAAARDIVKNVINLDGVAQARSVGTANGQIVLDGGTKGTVQVAGTLDARGTQAGEGGGAIAVLGKDIAVLDGARLLAGGTVGGGAVNVGTWESASASLNKGATLDASATEQGNGGSVKVIAQTTKAVGTITAKGGAKGGDGGFVETSGHHLDISGASVSTAAAKGKGGTWLLDPFDLVIDAAAATSINTALTGGNVTLQTTASGATTAYGGSTNGSGNGDIVINSAITWSTDTTLTLDAYHAVQVNANVTATGANAGLAVNTNNGGTLTTGAGASITLAGGNASLSINGQSYTLLRTAADLQNLATTGHYALAGDLSLSGLFTPIGYLGYNNFGYMAFDGVLEGLGHTVSNLTIYNSTGSNIGLFSGIGASGTVRNLTLKNASINGVISNLSSFGALAGVNSGTIHNTHVSGSVRGYRDVGGLVGRNGGTISNSSSSAMVDGNYVVGGLVGDGGGTVLNSWSSGSVNAGQDTAGGLVGQASGTIIGGSSSAIVTTAGNEVGGLVGTLSDNGRVVNSWSTGSASGYDAVGGLVGKMNGHPVISSSYSSATVSGKQNVGGLVGQAVALYGTPSISNSYATGTVTGETNVGGLVGSTVDGTSIANSYASGAVTGTSTVGGLIGYAAKASVADSYWDAQTTGQYAAAGGQDAESSITASSLTTAQAMQSNRYTGWDFGGTWYLVEGYTRPILRSEYSTTITNGHQLLLMNLNMSASYTLANNINLGGELASTGGIWTNSIGFVPIGFTEVDSNYTPTDFNGVFDGRGHTISGLSITPVTGQYYTYNYGLFSSIGNAGVVKNLGVINVKLTGNYRSAQMGALAGRNKGTITNSYSTGTGTGDNIGGLVGLNDYQGKVSSSYSSVVIHSPDMSAIGGLVSVNSGVITSSYATGDVTAGTHVGGLVGFNNDGTITSSYATGNVTAQITGDISAGGLIGYDFFGVISSSYATGTVSAGNYSGGLIGSALLSSVTGSYARGKVTGGGHAGGLVGYLNRTTIANSYATGEVTGPAGSSGGLVGTAIDGNITSSHWDTTSTKMAQGYGTRTGTGTFSAVGGTTSDLQTASFFSGWDFANTWHLASGAYPILLASPYVLRVTIGNASMTYGDSVPMFNIASYSGLWGNDGANVLGGLSLTSGGSSSADAGTYAITGSGSGSAVSTTGQAYTVVYIPGTLTINKRTVTVNTVAVDGKTYDGTTAAAISASGTTFNNLVNGDSVNVVGTAAFADAKAGTGKTVSITGLTLTGGDAGNYVLSGTTATSTADIGQRVLTLGTISTANKTYDGTTAAAIASYGTTLGNLVSGDAVSISGTAAFADAKAGTGKSVSITGLTLTGADAGNYLLSGTTATSTADIAQRVLTLDTIATANKTYDGTTAAAIAGYGTTLGNMVSGDAVSISGTAAFADAKAGTGKTVSITGLTLTGTDAGNYVLSGTTATSTADIGQRVLTLDTISTANKTYDGTTAAAIAGYGTTLGNVVSGDAVSIGGTAAFADANAGTGKTVSITGLTLTGADAGNYVLSGTTATSSADIGQRVLTLDTISTANKTYDGTTAAAIAGYGTTLGNVVSGDAVSIGGTAAFADANAGTGKTVSITGLTLTGADAGNYVLSGTTATSSADIGQRVLNVTAGNTTIVAGSPLSDFTLSYSGWVNGEGPGVLTAVPTVTTTATAASPAGTYTLVAAGGSAANYSFVYQNGSLVITPAPLQPSASRLGTNTLSSIQRQYAGVLGNSSFNSGSDAVGTLIHLRSGEGRPGLSGMAQPGLSVDPALLESIPALGSLHSSLTEGAGSEQ